MTRIRLILPRFGPWARAAVARVLARRGHDPLMAESLILGAAVGTVAGCLLIVLFSYL